MISNFCLLNHEHPLRGETFVTGKITRALPKIGSGLQDKVFLWNLDASRDGGHEKDYVDAMWRMLQQPEAEDFVIMTGKTRSILDFFKMAFSEIGVELEFKGRGPEEGAYVVGSHNPEYQLKAGKKVVVVDPKYYPLTEVDLLIGDASKDRQKLGWAPTHDLAGLIKEMLHVDIHPFKNEKVFKDSGFYVMNRYE